MNRSIPRAVRITSVKSSPSRTSTLEALTSVKNSLSCASMLGVLALAILLIVPVCSGNVHEPAIYYFEGSVKSGDTFDLEQGYRLTIDDIRKDSAAISISGGSEEIVNISISGDYTLEKEISRIDFDIIQLSMNLTGSDTASMVLEQYIDPDKPFDYPLIGAVSMSIEKGEREPLKEGYELEATSIIDNNAVITLYKGDNIVKQEKLSGNGERFVYMAKIDGQRRTILIAKLDRTSNNDSAHISGLSQFREPESTDCGGGDGGSWNAELADSAIFRYLLSVCVFACVLALIVYIAIVSTRDG